MKNKILLCACAGALVAVLMTSCREKTDFNAICDDVSKQSITGLFSGVDPEVDDLVLNVVQYRFNEDLTAECTVMALGDGVYQAPVTTTYALWELGGYGDDGISRKIILTPVGDADPVEVLFSLGGIFSDDYPFAGDKNDKVKGIEEAQDAIVAKKWFGNDTTYFKIDTVIDIMKYDTTYSYKPKKDPDTGKTMRDSAGHVIYEQTISKIDSALVPTKMKWPIAPKTVNIRSLELNRDASLVNTGSWSLIVKEFEMDENRVVTTKLDTAASYNFHWAFAGFTSSSSFLIRARQADGTQEYFDVKYDSKIPAMTIDKQILKVQE